MSSFFTLPASQRKRKRADQPRGPASKKRIASNGSEKAPRSTKAAERDESISGSDSEDGDALPAADESLSDDQSESDEGETAAERRLKLAERYLENVREDVEEIGFDAADVDRDLIAERLKEDAVCYVSCVRVVCCHTN
jgi:ribosomal RNA-processing protein 9